MSLTSLPFCVATIVLAVVGAGLTLWLWPRVARNRIRDVLARAGLLAMVNLLVLLSAATLLNATYGFFASWADLAGAFSNSPPPQTVNYRGAPAIQAAATRDRYPMERVAVATRSLPPGSEGEGPVLRYTVNGRASGVSADVLVQLPRGYFAPMNRSRRYPVLETFQGYPGSPADFIDYLDIGRPIDRLVARGRLGGMIVVSPDTEIPTGKDSECVNGILGYPQIETWLSVDVPNWVLANFRTRADRSSWATIGFSAGGWCAAEVAMLNPARYAAAIVLGGYFRPWFSSNYDPLPRDSRALERYNLIELARRDPPPVAIWLETSQADSDSYPTSAAFLRAVRAPLAAVSVVLVDAGHRTSVWEAELPNALRWLGSTVPGFRAASAQPIDSRNPAV